MFHDAREVVRRSLPVFRDKSTFSESVGMSQRCQYRKLVIRTNDLIELPPLDGAA